MADNAGLSAALDGIPMVADAAARDARFPLATRKQNQRVFRLDTGVQQRWSGSTWVDDSVGNVVSIMAHGDVATDASVACQAAIDAAPNGAVILISPGAYTFSSVTPTIAGRTDLTFVAHGATITLSGANRQALLLSGTNTRIRWYGGRIVGSGVVADNHQAIGTVVDPPPAGTITRDLLVSDLAFESVVRGLYVTVQTLGEASDITYRRCTATNIVGTASGTGYAFALSGVYGGAMESLREDGAKRHGFYISASQRIQLRDLRSINHSGEVALTIARSGSVTLDGLVIHGATGNGAMSVEPHESDTSADTARIQLRNITITDTAAGQQDVLIGGADPATSSVLSDVLIDGLTVRRIAGETALVESVLIRHGTNITVRNVHYYATGAYTGQKSVVYLAAQGGDTYTSNVTVEGVRARAPNLGVGGTLSCVEVNTPLCSGSQRLTFRDNEGTTGGASISRAVVYDAARTNTQIEARGNRMHGALSGTAVLVAGTVTVATAEVQTGDRIMLSRQATGGTVGHLSIGTITDGSTFVITSSSATDTSTIFWEIVH